MRGGRLSDEVTSQTQAIQSVASKQFIIFLIFDFFDSALRHQISFLTLHPCSFPPLLVPLQVWQSGSGFRRFPLGALTPARPPAFSLSVSRVPLPLSLARFPHYAFASCSHHRLLERLPFPIPCVSILLLQPYQGCRQYPLCRPPPSINRVLSFSSLTLSLACQVTIRFGASPWYICCLAISLVRSVEHFAFPVSAQFPRHSSAHTVHQGLYNLKVGRSGCFAPITQKLYGVVTE